ncbi:MAG: hypothetical protein ABW007_17820 [Chitinophagaceae bacterium]
MTKINYVSARKLMLSCFIVASLAFFVAACKKGLTGSGKIDTSFGIDAAKEWYYGTFKKSRDWASYNGTIRGVKSPKWDNGRYFKTGNMEIVEFPLVKTKSALYLPANNRSTSDMKRIAEATLARVVFMKRDDGQIFVREVEYIPDWDYASRHGFDISSNSLAALEKDFTGRIIIKTWGEEEISRRLIVDGVGRKIGHLKQLPSGTSQQMAEKVSVNSQNCTMYQICEFERECHFVWVGDMLEKICEQWESTGNCWYEEYCDGDPDCNPGLANCQCEVYGICDEDPGGEEEEDCTVKEARFQGASCSEKNEIEEESATATEMTKKYKWTIFKQSWGLYSFQSLEKAKLIKTTNVTNPWKFTEFTHNSVWRSATQFGVSFTCTVHDSETYIGSAGYAAGVELEYVITFAAACKGSPIAGDWPCTSAAVWTANE